MTSADHQPTNRRKKVLVTGATGYVGSRLIPRILPHHDVRCLVRNPDKLDPAVRDRVEITQGDVQHSHSLRQCLEGVDVAYYLIHGMGYGDDFQKKDRLAAEGFVQAAKSCGVERIIYLGGLGDDNDPGLSPHLKSRHEVGEIFRNSDVPAIELRASVVLGPGSLSYELIRSLTQRLPMMICPRWLATPTQPIATEDVLAYLEEALDLPMEKSEVYEIGCQDVVTYGDLIKMYAKERNLTRILVSVPLLTPYLSSLWLGLVTPTSAEVGRHLIEGLRNPTVVRDDQARKIFSHQPMTTKEAIHQAVQQEA
ncbi:NAD(P)H-binding protein [Bremerella sp. TYQ1]|uniref:NAD(P)H-binding protein n=1 Tax=Bremerella sp. TYQ1 TaxID=3119568 RepID=UPI001CCE968D|nr:NAD(P)H-binding protein [Bremerella volcania]UBM34437.1 NAD(P)H-binding protein [Bremerella volcania]